MVVTYTVGRLIRTHFLAFLNELKFKGHISDYAEAKGFLHSEFTVSGEKSGHMYIATAIKLHNRK